MNKYFTTMKDNSFISVLCLTLAMIFVAGSVSAQRRQVAEWRDGDYVVRRYIVTDDRPHSEVYEIHYAVNSSSADDSGVNGDVMVSLDRFFEELKSDTLRHVKSIAIAGYASPDGTVSFNTELARRRAQQLSTMLAHRYNLRGTDIVITSYVEPWSATTDAIEHSTLSNRGALVNIVNAKEAPMVVDGKLKRDGAAWQYLKSDVLPDMRRAVVTVSYTEDVMQEDREYSPVEIYVEEFVVVEEPERHKDRHESHPKDAHHKHKRDDRRKVIILNEWEGVIYDAGASGDCCAVEYCYMNNDKSKRKNLHK